MTKFAANTDVPVEKTKGDIERLLSRYKATRFGYMAEPGAAIIMFEAQERMIRFKLPMPLREEFLVKEVTVANQSAVRYHRQKQRTPEQVERAFEQAVRQRWRALYLIILAKLEAIETGIVDFDDEFLAQSVMPDRRTVGEWLKPQLKALFVEGKLPPMLPMPND